MNGLPSFYITVIYFFYGLSFFSMGLLIWLEVDRCTNDRLRHALLFLGAFGLLHGAHEWMEMFDVLGLLENVFQDVALRESGRIFVLAFSFLSLATFGTMLIVSTPQTRRLGLLVPLSMAAIWSFGALILRQHYNFPDMWAVLNVWARYVLAIPAALLACIGLVFQQREFRREGMSQFGRDALWSAIAFAWYGLVGQIFTQPSPLPPSNVLNNQLFLDLFGFPVQLLRTGAAIFAAVFVVRFLRSFEVETLHMIAELQKVRLEEAEHREQVYGELLRRVVAAQEAERQRIARELHDETGQALTAIGLGLRGVSTQLHQNSDKASSNLRQLEGLVAGSLDELQRLIADLRPSHLDDLGLPAALRWYAGEVQKRADIKVSVETQGEVAELPAEMKTALFRVAQEAMTNVVKHSHATAASVRLIFRSDAVVVEVEDNGCGFDPRIMRTNSRPSWGLLGMEERASLLGGTLVLWSQKDAGTRVQVTIPYYKFPEVKDGYPFGLSG